MIADSRVKIKICGITNIEDAVCACKFGTNALGFIFYSKSPRYINPHLAKEIISKLNKRVKKVGVFVNAEANYVKKISRMCKLDMLQFHGNESPSFCREFPRYKIIKAFRIKDKSSFKDISRYEKADYYLFDSFKRGFFGGTGRRFRLFLFKDVRIEKPFFLSGGLNPENVKGAIKFVHPDWVDVSSGLESSVGKKDIKLLKEFIDEVKLV